MKKVILSIALSLAALISVNAENVDNVKFYGIDYSSVNVYYAGETADQFISAFERINMLMISESEKYDVGKYLNVKVDATDIKCAIKMLSDLNDRNFTDLEEENLSVATIISKYPSVEGNVLILIARELNKLKATGRYDIVIFDGQTKKIIKQSEFTGKAGGFGLRNFWAGSIYKGLTSHWKQEKRRR